MDDTSPQARQRYTELLRKKSPAERAVMVASLNHAVRTLAVAGIKAAHPGATERQVSAHLAARLYGDEVARRLFPDMQPVLSELRRGARTSEAIAHVERLREALTVEWAPAPDDWWEAGELIRAVGDARDWEVNKRREFQNDALIALTARRNGATVVTTNRDDFQVLAQKTGVSVIIIGKRRISADESRCGSQLVRCTHD